MKRILALAITVTALSLVTESTASAQGYQNGYNFGAGYFSARRGSCDQDQAPFFARHPPVYYSHIVKRPFGISPYPAPAGIMPTEMMVQPAKPVTIVNPFFDMESAPALAPPVQSLKPDNTLEEKTTWISNPFLPPVAKK